LVLFINKIFLLFKMGLEEISSFESWKRLVDESGSCISSYVGRNHLAAKKDFQSGKVRYYEMPNEGYIRVVLLKNNSAVVDHVYLFDYEANLDLFSELAKKFSKLYVPVSYKVEVNSFNKSKYMFTYFGLKHQIIKKGIRKFMEL
jgi:hypothetical protein